MPLIDLSHVIENELITYKGLPAPIICDYISREQSKAFYANDTTFQIDKIEMVGNTGTYIDCPFHRYEEGRDTSEMELERFADLEAIVIRVPFEKTLAIDTSYFQNLEVKGKAVLVHTGWSKHWNTEQYYEGHPFLTREAALFLKDNGATLVGIDSHNIDNVQDLSRPVHSILLKNEILIVEHLCNLESLPDNQPFTFSAVPPKMKGVGTFPVRAFARV